MKLLLLHAHPDDESMIGGGLTLRAADAGFDVTLVYGTSGGLGEKFQCEQDLSNHALADLREEEATRAAEILGVNHCVFLRYADSGHKKNANPNCPACFSGQDPEIVASEIADIEGSDFDIIVTYDDYGTYGHRDHIFSSRVGDCLAEKIPYTTLINIAFNRDHLLSSSETSLSFLDYVKQRSSFGRDQGFFDHFIELDNGETTKIAEAISCHASQLRPNSLLSNVRDTYSEEARNILDLEWMMTKCQGRHLRSFYSKINANPYT